MADLDAEVLGEPLRIQEAKKLHGIGTGHDISWVSGETGESHVK